MVPVVLFWIFGAVCKLQMAHGDEVLWLNNWRIEPWNTIFRYITALGEWPPYVLFALLFAKWNYRIVLIIVLAGAVTIPASGLLKRSFRQLRPTTYFEQKGNRDALVTIPEIHTASGDTSFPSGHTFAAFSLYSLLTLAAHETHGSRKMGLAFALAAILTALSRVFLAQHFLADVLAGSVLGLLWGTFWWQVSLYFKKFSRLEKGWQQAQKQY